MKEGKDFVETGGNGGAGRKLIKGADIKS